MLSRVRFFKQYSSFFPGESAWLTPNVVDDLVNDRKAKRYLPNSEELEEWPEAVAKPTEVIDGADDVSGLEEDNKPKPEGTSDLANDPFLLDGLDDVTSQALHAGGLNTPGDVEAYLNEGKLLTDLPKVTAARAKKVTELYGVK